MGGRYVVCVVTAHALLIIWGYAVQAHTGVLTESAALVTQYPDVLFRSDGRPVRRLRGDRARLAHHLGLRRPGAYRRADRVGGACHPVPGRADGDRGRLLAARRRHRLDARGPSPAALRDLVLPAPVHL